MNRDQAKEILFLYRPGTADAEDVSFSEALRLCDLDPELKLWFDEHCSQQLALRSKFKQFPVPAGLKEQILAERKIHTTPFLRRPAVLAVVAVLLVVAGVVTFWQRQPKEDLGFTGYVSRMATLARRGYTMDLETKDPAKIRAYFATNQAPADYSLPARLEGITLTGCALKDWQGAKVSMICYNSGSLLQPGQTTDLWVFVIDRASVQGAPVSSSPTITPINGATAASWTVGNRTYLMIAEGNAEFLRKYL